MNTTNHVDGHPPESAAIPAQNSDRLPPGQLFMDGAWCDSRASQRRTVVNPATGLVITTAAEADAEDVSAAVAAARQAFDTGAWPRMPGRERARTLFRVAELIRTHADELAMLETTDTGKPLQLSKMVDITTTIDLFEYYAALAWSIDGATRQTAAPMLAYTRREPLGVVAAITPFNFPLVLSVTKIAPALAAGNTMVHKPADETPLTALRLAELLHEAGVPDGAFNVVTGGGKTGEHLVRHPQVDKIAFTGSTTTGRRVAALAAETVKPVTVELGGKSANIVFADADPVSAIAASVTAFVFNTGQFCAAGTRLLVQRPVFDDVVAGVTAGASTIPVGDPLSPHTVIGPLAGQRHLDKVRHHVDRAVREQGATLLAGGERLADTDGYFYAPTVLADVDQHAAAVQEEIFGPVLTVQPFDTEEEAIMLANGTAYGLAAGLHTTDVSRAHRVAERLRAGTVWVNTWGMLDVTVPFGGCKQSGYGREQGPEALAEYTQTKSVLVAVAPDAAG
ncbi:MAG: aldehyde dehydrogenase [Dactylosporangium sp.]|nr:aldehyde dehydrogenase family protein [Dactylosporangium sp.]NNJ59854.1 aldehyde dehydrogenase [Dactylosporangium sp.]